MINRILVAVAAVDAESIQLQTISLRHTTTATRFCQRASEYDFAFAMLGFGEFSPIFPAMPDGLGIVKRFDRIAAADGAAFLDPAIEA